MKKNNFREFSRYVHKIERQYNFHSLQKRNWTVLYPPLIDDDDDDNDYDDDDEELFLWYG